MRDEIDNFIRGIPDFEQVSKNRYELLRHFGFFLTEVLGDQHVRPARLKSCFDAAFLRAPGNISEAMRRSGSFVRTNEGQTLARDVRERIAAKVRPAEATPRIGQAPSAEEGKTRNVFVIYGRDEGLRQSMFAFLRSLGLNPLEWSEAVRLTGKGSPHVWEIVKALFSHGQAVVALLSPDEEVRLRPELSDDPSDAEPGWQPRPNVLIEAGMALALDEARTILVQVGPMRPITDLGGRHVIHINNTPEKRADLADRLQTAGCDIKKGVDWLSTGEFVVVLPKAGRGKNGKRRTAKDAHSR